MRTVSTFTHRISTGWVALVGLLIFILFTALVLPGQSSQSDASTENVGSPDLSFYYSVDDLYEMADAYGDVGRAEYIRARMTFDVVWPLVYGVFLATSISWLSSRGFKEGSLLQQSNVLPILGVLLDYLENLSTSLVMHRYPSRTAVVDFLAPIFTAVKWSFVGASFVLLVIATAAWILSLAHKSK